MVTDSIQFVRAVPTTKGWTHREVGTVFADLEVANGYDIDRAIDGLVPRDAIRRAELTDVLVDTGATHLGLRVGESGVISSGYCASSARSSFMSSS